MKLKLLSLIVLLAIVFVAKAQGNYFNYLDSSTEIRHCEYLGWSNETIYNTDYFDGDTIINGNYYYIRYTLSIDTTSRQPINITKVRYGPDYIRETPDLYFLQYIPIKNVDDTILDNNKILNASIGSNFYYNSSYYCMVNHILHLQFGSKSLKQLLNTYKTIKSPHYLTEGIGDLHYTICGLPADMDPWINYINKQKDTINFYPQVSYSSFPIPVRTAHFTNISLPVTLQSFKVQGFKSFNIINWQTATEINTSHFNIQRSTTGKDFTTIGKVNAKGASEYSFNDPLATEDTRFKKLYYRLQIVDKDGALSYSEVRELSIINSPLSITPNPAKDNVTVSGANLKQVKLLDNLGRVVAVKEVANSSTVSIPVSQIAKGIYMVQATFKDGSIKTEKVMVE